MRKISTRISLVALVLLFSSTVFGAVFTVTNNADSGPGSLRQAVLDANAAPGADVIAFNISGSTFITLSTPIVVTDALNIDGYSQTSTNPGPIDARNIGVTILTTGSTALVINTGNVSVSGLAILGTSTAISVGLLGGTGGNVKIWGNNIGMSQINLPLNSGFGFAPITTHGIYVEGEIAGPPYVVPRVFIGTDGDGNADANEGNWIVNCGVAGIYIASADQVVIAGNYIGTTQSGNGNSGSWTLGNGDGILLDGLNAGNGASNNRIGTNADGISDVLERNIISINKNNGIHIVSGGSNNIIAGNFIGMANAGTAAGNALSGILLTQVNGNFIGVTPTGGSPVQANTISSNGQHGILIQSGDAPNPASGNVIMGNFIGTNSADANLGNTGSGVYLRNSPFINGNFTNGSVVNNIIGSNDDGSNDNLEGNTIRFNTADGVSLFQDNATASIVNNRISRNSFSNNAGLGINLLGGFSPTDGVTPNDVGDADTGPNDLYNFPVITSFGVDASFVSATGTAPAGSLIQFYRASADAAPGNPNVKEGQFFLFNGQDNGPGDLDPALGAFTFIWRLVDLANPVAAGQEVNAIAISTASGAGNTSEFSEIAAIILPVQFVSFDAQLQGDKVLVSWATAQEQNASHFEVQKSTDGISFATIGSVKAKGNSNSLLNYAFTDNNVAPGVSYYRLRQVDLDAKYVYTKTVPIRNEGRGKAFFAWPNPVKDVLNVTLNQTKAENLMLRVVDYNGRTLRSNQINTVRGMNQVSLNFSGLPPGMYIIQINGGETTLTQKIIKN